MKLLADLFEALEIKLQRILGVANQKKRIVLLRLIPFDQDFEFPQAKFIFGLNMLQLPWLLGAPMPANLLGDIIKAMQAPATKILPSPEPQRPGQGIAAANAGPDHVPTARSIHRAFGSMRFDGVVPLAAAELQNALAQRNPPAHLEIINMVGGGDIDHAVQQGIIECSTFIVLGSAKYGEQTDNAACTYYESKFAQSQKKNIILIRMISQEQEFQFPQARFMFGLGMLELPWLLGTPMPADLPDRIVEAMESPSADRSTSAVVNPLAYTSVADTPLTDVPKVRNYFEEEPASSMVAVKIRRCTGLNGLLAAFVVLLCLIVAVLLSIMSSAAPVGVDGSKMSPPPALPKECAPLSEVGPAYDTRDCAGGTSPGQSCNVVCALGYHSANPNRTEATFLCSPDNSDTHVQPQGQLLKCTYGMTATTKSRLQTVCVITLTLLGLIVVECWCRWRHRVLRSQDGHYTTFVSHCKADGDETAAALHNHFQALRKGSFCVPTDRGPNFIDTVELEHINPQQLVIDVKRSRVFVLVLTKKVLTTP